MCKKYRVPILFIIIYLIFFTQSVSAEDKEIDMMTTPDKILFSIDNFKPGDWAVRTITITNSGKEDFHYVASGKLTNGSKKLYDALILTITSGDEQLYNGQLGNFKKLRERPIPSGGKEELTFQIQFPPYLGNEYQGLTSEVQMKFYAAGTLGGLLPVDGPKLPNTSTNSYTLLLAGTLMLFSGSGIFYYRRKMISEKNK
ncbi:LPXTG cell wall anchor domain-containing protein [Bacillus kwashiorkori]|uniref:LPXTG cell wall anchor domain-containing protein n=1 Tax=Bacillus kwashiorkori TaxID=1522318 RepID=UPI0007821DA8|nr:LPXTG cell wall anchor domain-containing protein [Bacillus kwashiorkori]